MGAELQRCLAGWESNFQPRFQSSGSVLLPLNRIIYMASVVQILDLRGISYEGLGIRLSSKFLRCRLM